jgi:hypothetical protein
VLIWMRCPHSLAASSLWYWNIQHYSTSLPFIEPVLQSFILAEELKPDCGKMNIALNHTYIGILGLYDYDTNRCCIRYKVWLQRRGLPVSGLDLQLQCVHMRPAGWALWIVLALLEWMTEFLSGHPGQLDWLPVPIWKFLRGDFFQI